MIAYAVTAAARYISDRFLPDKAIDLVDEAGAYREIHPTDTETQTVDKALITDILARICKVDVLAMKEEDNATLETLHERISAKIYGQEEAVCQVVEAVQMAKAGLRGRKTNHWPAFSSLAPRSGKDGSSQKYWPPN